MVIKGMYQLTNWGNPDELILTSYGVISRRKFLQEEQKRFKDSIIKVNEQMQLCLFVKGERADTQ